MLTSPLALVVVADNKRIIASGYAGINDQSHL
jgi:hypothetical protein